MISLRLEMLTDDEETVQICKDYWECDENGKFTFTVAELTQRYSIKSFQSESISRIAYNNCNAYSANVVCSRCNQPFVFENRKVYQQAVRHPEQVCSECQEENIAILRAEREAALALQKAQEEAALKQRRDAIQKVYALGSPRVPDIHALTLEDAVYLLSFVRVAASEDLTIYGPVVNAVERLSPTSDYSVEIVKHLMAKNLIVVHPDSSPDAFDFKEEKVTYNVNKVLYSLPTSNDAEATSRFITQLQSTFRTREWWPYKWHEQKLSLWKEVALHECLEYLVYILNQHQLPFNPGDKTRLVLSNLLEQYAVSQIFTMIYSCGVRAAAYYQKGGVTRQHAANTVVGRIEGYGDRAVAERWSVTYGGRDYNCPQSMVSRVLFNTVFKIGDKGLNEPPRAFDLADAESSPSEDDTSDDAPTSAST